MRYVLDASVGVKWVMNEVDSAVARRLRDNYRNQIHDLIVPDSFPLETAHALTKAERRGIVTDATKLWVDLMLDSLQLFPSLPLMLRALSIATQARIGVYDCLDVALVSPTITTSPPVPIGRSAPMLHHRPVPKRRIRRAIPAATQERGSRFRPVPPPATVHALAARSSRS
jgi:predicted nucleic acid-binding protein